MGDLERLYTAESQINMARGWPAGLDICYIVRLLENMLRTLTPPAVVAADHGRSDGSAHSHRACAADKPLGSAGGHGRSLCA